MKNILLKELYIDNFKSFKNSKFEFGKVNCLIAPNNAGKSNLVEVFELLNNVLNKNLGYILKNTLDTNNYRYESDTIQIIALFEVSNTIILNEYLISYKFDITIEILIDTSSRSIQTRMSSEGKIKGVEVSSEDIKEGAIFSIIDSEDIKTYLLNYDNYINLLDKKRFFYINKQSRQANDLYSMIINARDTKVNISRAGEMINGELNIFNTIDIFSSFYFHPQTIKKQQNYETDFLLKDGTNLAYFLDTVDEEIFENISMSLIGEVELIESIEITKSSVPTILFNETVNGNIKKIIHQKISDGTIHFLSLMTALYGSKSNCLVFEEPERHMHMKTLSYILNTMRDSDKQIFFTTHSTEILQQLELDEIFFIFRDFDGNTQGKRAKDIEHIKTFMKMYKNNLVEMIQIGILGEYEE